MDWDVTVVVLVLGLWRVAH